MTPNHPNHPNQPNQPDPPRDDGHDRGLDRPAFPASADQSYFRAVEELFVALRGAPMLLSPTDWQIASSWRQRGIPLPVIREALESVFAKRRDRGATSRVNSLRYCAPAVEKAWRATTELGRLAETGAPAAASASGPVAVLLQRLAASLPPELPQADVWSARVLALDGDADEVERQLAEVDAELLSALESALPSSDRDALQRAARSAAKRLEGRLGASELERAERRLAEVRLREHWKLPVLSLFATATATATATLASASEPTAPEDPRGAAALEPADRAKAAEPEDRGGRGGEHDRG